MVLKSALAAALCTGLLMSGSAALADEYRAGEFLGLDLSRPCSRRSGSARRRNSPRFRIEARTDRKPVKTERVVVPKAAAPKPHVAHERVERPTRVVQERAEKPRGAARAKLARRHSNPLDAQARDTRIQTWPCKSGGICGWQR